MPHEMTDDKLCRAVAVEVMNWHMGGQIRPTKQAMLRGTDGPSKIIPLELTGNDMLRVIEAMRADGWKFSGACEGKGEWRTIFWPSGEEFLSLEDTTVGDTFPRAVFEAALLAKRAWR